MDDGRKKNVDCGLDAAYIVRPMVNNKGTAISWVISELAAHAVLKRRRLRIS